ncbi:MAG TPA: fibronectin type III domain-containing protein [Polyangiaceae bacterium]
MRGIFFFGTVVLFPALAFSACSSNNSPSGTSITCGPGTELDGSVCYGVTPAPTGTSSGQPDSAAPPAMDSGSGGGNDGTAPPVDAGPTGPAAPTFGGATAAAPSSTTSLLITWQPATDAITPSSLLVYDVFVGTKAGGENFAAPTVTSPPGATSVVVDGLVAGSTYYAVVRARNQAKLSDTNTVETSGSPQADSRAPTFAGATSAKSAPEGGVVLSWAAAIDDLTPTPGMGYFVYVATTAGAENYALPSFSTDPGVTSFTVPGLPQPNTTYYFVARAHDAAGNLDNNIVEVSAMPGPDTVAPTFGGCTAAVTKSSTQVTVSWDQATDNTTPAAQIVYDVYAATAAGQEDYTTPSGSFTGALVGVVTGLKPSTSYVFVCRARDLSGNEDTNTSERTATTPVDTTPPTFAGLTSVSNVTATQVQLNWAAATDPQTLSTDIVYDVFQSTTVGGEAFTSPPSASSTPGATSIVLTNLPPSTKLYWVVRARDEAQNEDTNTVEMSATTGVSFSENVQPIFTQHCAVVGCHVPGNPPEGQVLAAGFAYANIVNVASQEVPADMRVAPGDLSHSYLYMKITAQQTVGEYMPPPATNDVLSATDKATIMNWIVEGAANN